MQEPDDRLAGDLVWELFPSHAPHGVARRARRILDGLLMVTLAAVAWYCYPPLGVAVACLGAACRDVLAARRFSNTIPDKAGGTICALFTYAWASWKIALTAILLMVVTVALTAQKMKAAGPPAAFATASVLCFGGFFASSLFTAAGLVKSLRSGMRVWIGSGINQARTLLLGMLIVGFTLAVIAPTCLWLVGRVPRATDSGDNAFPMALGTLGFMFAGSIAILVAVDWLARRVIAAQPGKFGPKVPSVGKWKA